jgi:hypothetical protein
MLLSAFVAGSAMADGKATKSANCMEKSKQECCAKQEGCCCKAMKSEKTSKSSKEEKRQEKKEAETPESK